MTAIQEKIIHILRERCEVTQIPEDSEQDINLDSMALMALIVGLEKEFDIQLDNSKLENLYHACSLNSLTKLVTSQS